jgi:hypothetical protein
VADLTTVCAFAHGRFRLTATSGRATCIAVGRSGVSVGGGVDLRFLAAFGRFGFGGLSSSDGVFKSMRTLVTILDIRQAKKSCFFL